MKKLSLLLAVILLTALTAFSVLAEDQAAPPAKVKKVGMGFDKMDSDKDGKLSFEELKAARPKIRERQFDKMDANSDKSISKEELTDFHKARKEAVEKAKKDKQDSEGEGNAQSGEKHKKHHKGEAKKCDKADTPACPKSQS